MQPGEAITVSTLTLKRIAITAIVAGLAILIVALLWQERDRFAGFLDRGIGSHIQSDRYQAVFLTGGQVFFGRLVSRGDVVLLSDVFYLSTPPDANTGDQGTLVKRGGELFGPLEPMVIPKEQVLFLENLNSDSQVVQAIQRFRSGQTSPPATQRPVTTAVPSPTRP